MDWFCSVVRAQSDKIYGVQEEYMRDIRDNKINLSIGVYRDENGLPYVPPSVVKAEQIVISKNMTKEYAPIEGFADFRQTVAKFIFGDESDLIKRERHATIQGLGGTGSLRIGAIFLNEFLTKSKLVYLPMQTWSAHNQVFSHSGFEVKHYRYWNSKSLGLDFEAMIEDISNMTSHSIIVLHSIAHNPTGADPTLEQWQQIIDLIKQKNLFAFLDCAYQGFASGSIDDDSKVNQLFAKQINQFIVAFTFAKNMGLYGERIGALSVVCNHKEQAKDVLSQLKRVTRPIYSHPPNQGARIVTHLLNDPELKNEWFNDVKNMWTRITRMRSQLIEELNGLSSGKHNWDFIGRQQGMYAYSGLTEPQVLQLRQQFGVYVADDGRVNIAAINHKNIKQIANAIHYIKEYSDN